jgi:hypothetical protein
MKMKLLISISILICCFIPSCDNTLQCERHFISKGYVGKVVIYFNQKNGQRQFDKDGCIIYNISEKGECFSSLPYKEGTAYPNKTFKYFEVITKDSVNEIFEFEKNEYLRDTVGKKQKKYVFFLSSGYSAPNYTFEYYVDYGINYKNHLYN